MEIFQILANVPLLLLQIEYSEQLLAIVLKKNAILSGKSTLQLTSKQKKKEATGKKKGVWVAVVVQSYVCTIDNIAQRG